MEVALRRPYRQRFMPHPNIHRFLIVRLGSLGDVIHGIPVAAALRERYPFARIDWMVDPRYVELLGLVRGLNAAIPVDPRRHLRSLVATLRGLRRVRYTAAVDLQGLLKSAVLARLAGAWQTIGLPREHLREPLARAFYTDTADPGAHTHVVFKNLSLLTPLGIREPRPAFPLAIPDSAAVEAARESVGAADYTVNTNVTPATVTLANGASWPTLTYAAPDSVVARIVVGWADPDAIPAVIKSWMKLAITAMYENRGLVQEREAVLTPFAERLLDRYRILSV